MGCCKKTGCCQSGQNQEVPDYLVCTCMGVMRSEIVEAIESGIDTFEGLSDELGVGTGCSSCVEEVQMLLAKKKQQASGCCSKR